jgi:hypothetical protein
LELLIKSDSSIENSPENIGLGSMAFHALTTPYVEIAGDGKTAKGLWYSPGLVAVAATDGVDSLWVYENYGVDFIREADGWKIWHLFIGTDFSLVPGALMKDMPVSDTEEDEVAPPEMSIVMNAYSARHNRPAYPYIPQPYETYDPAFGNGPEGNPKYGKGDAIK